MTDLSRVSAVTRRYARALFLAALEQGALEPVERDVERIRHATSHPEVAGWLADPRVEDAHKQASLERVLGPGVHTLTRGLLGLVGRRRRHAILAGLAGAFQVLVDQHAGRLRGVVESTSPLDEAQLRVIEQALAVRTRREVILDPGVDASLLGGVRVTLAGKRYDGTLAARVESMRRRLTAADLGRIGPAASNP